MMDIAVPRLTESATTQPHTRTHPLMNHHLAARDGCHDDSYSFPVLAVSATLLLRHGRLPSSFLAFFVLSRSTSFDSGLAPPAAAPPFADGSPSPAAGLCFTASFTAAEPAAGPSSLFRVSAALVVFFLRAVCSAWMVRMPSVALNSLEVGSMPKSGFPSNSYSTSNNARTHT